MKYYRKKGLIQVRVWIDKEDEEFVKYIAKFCREERKKKTKERYGRPANHHQITLTKAIASAKNLPEPEHLYDYHISLSAWMWGNGGGN